MWRAKAEETLISLKLYLQADAQDQGCGGVGVCYIADVLPHPSSLHQNPKVWAWQIPVLISLPGPGLLEDTEKPLVL